MAGGIFICRQLARAIAHGSRLSVFYTLHQWTGIGPVLFSACLAGVSGSVLAAVWIMKDKKRNLYYGAFAGLFFLTGYFLCGKAMSLSDFYPADRLEIAGTGKICRISEREGEILLEICDVETVNAESDRLPGKLHIVLNNDKEENGRIAIGRRIRFKGEFTLYNEGTNPGEFNYREYCLSQGIAGQVRCSADEVSPYGKESVFLQTLYELKQRIGEKLLEIASGDDAGVLICLVTGDKSGLSQRWKELFAEGGIIHLLTISGLHISILGMGVFRILRETVMGLAGGSIMAGMITVSFCLMAGSGTSMVRAVVCFLLYLLAECTGKTYDFLTGISLAGILILMEHPLMLFQSGFLMTYSCVLGIGILFPLCEAIFQPEQPWEKAILSSVLLQMISLPAQMWFQGKVSVFGVFVNLMTVPWMGMVLLSSFAGVTAGFVWNPLGTYLLGAAHVILQFFKGICLAVERIPFSSFVTGQPRWWQLVLWFVLLGGFIGNCWKKLLWKHRKLRWNRCILLLPLSILLLKRVPLPWLSSVYLDVGQGDGIVIEIPWNRSIVCIDGGSSSRKNIGTYVYEPFFLHEGISTVDYWIITHPDSDHYSGMMELLEKGYPIGTILMPSVFRGSDAAVHIEKMHPIQYIQAGDSMKFSGLIPFADEQFGSDDILLEVLHPGEAFTGGDLEGESAVEWKSTASGNDNDQSAVLLLTAGNLQFLYTGDMENGGEQAVMNRMDSGKNGVILKTAHHGSRSSTSEAFLDAVKPKMAVISSGKNNRYGHPHQEILERFRAENIPWWNTAEYGCIRITGGNRVTVEDKYCKIASFRI